jgi:hypothetical protein
MSGKEPPRHLQCIKRTLAPVGKWRRAVGPWFETLAILPQRPPMVHSGIGLMIATSLAVNCFT